MRIRYTALKIAVYFSTQFLRVLFWQSFLIIKVLKKNATQYAYAHTYISVIVLGKYD